ncbi:peptidoglycan glycosyltransferase FtsW [Pacificimonas pallii]|nr:putative peptidoglycan glycosyltransferase FtsW [Pacificimonas pallii]
MFSRGDRTILGRWFWTIDRPLLGMVLLLMGIGLIAVAAASPAASQRLSGANYTYADLYFLKRQVIWVAIGLPVLIAVSMLPKLWTRRLALLGTAGGLAALAALPFLGDEGTNGAVRWIIIGGSQVQPSELLKPMFIVTTAWLLAFRFDDPKVPAIPASGLLLVLIVALLMIQPDLGQTVLVSSIWVAQAFIAGLSATLLAILIAIGAVGILMAYLFVPHVTSRIDRFITGEGDNFQAERSIDAIRSGGLFGTGPGEGQAKFSLPEPHTDYIFAVIGEEFGMIACLFVAILFLAIVVRVITQLFDEDDPFVTVAAAGLAAQIGLQAFINMIVALDLLPSKGMTLPFISHGGSSFLALCIGTGMLLSLTRRSRFLTRAAEPEMRLGAT